MQITIPDLQQQPLEFDLMLPPGAIDYGIDILQVGGMHASGRADHCATQSTQPTNAS